MEQAAPLNPGEHTQIAPQKLSPTTHRASGIPVPKPTKTQLPSNPQSFGHRFKGTKQMCDVVLHEPHKPQSISAAQTLKAFVLLEEDVNDAIGRQGSLLLPSSPTNTPPPKQEPQVWDIVEQGKRFSRRQSGVAEQSGVLMATEREAMTCLFLSVSAPALAS